MIIELLLLLITLTIAYSLLINRIRGLPPGPPPLPLLGNALSFGEPIDEVMLRWSKKYGPVFTVWMPRPTVVIADHKTLQESIVKQGDLFGNRALNHNQMEMLVGGDYGLVFGGNEMWKEQRRFALHSLRDLGYLSSTLQEQAKTYAQQIVANWKEKGANGVDVTENVMFGVGNIIWQLVFGRILPFGDPKFKLASERTHKFFVDVFHPCVTFLEIFPQIAYFDPLFGYPIRRLKNTSDTNMGIIKKELDITEKSVNYDDEPRCYADAFLIEMKRREEKGEEMGNFNRQQLVLASLDMWSAGFETTVTTLRVAIHFLMSHPDVQRKMQKEIDEKIGQRQISLDDHKQLPYCMAAIQEVQRCGNIVELNFFRKTEQETVIGGHNIPAGTAILPQFPTVHIDPDNFERPDKLTFEIRILYSHILRLFLSRTTSQRGWRIRERLENYAFLTREESLSRGGTFKNGDLHLPHNFRSTLQLLESDSYSLTTQNSPRTISIYRTLQSENNRETVNYHLLTQNYMT